MYLTRHVNRRVRYNTFLYLIYIIYNHIYLYVNRYVRYKRHVNRYVRYNTFVYLIYIIYVTLSDMPQTEISGVADTYTYATDRDVCVVDTYIV